jgi:hypothetical protein
MKNVFRVIGLIAIAVVIAFSIAACGEPKDDKDDKGGDSGNTGLNAGSNGSLGPTVNVPEVQVYDIDESDNTVTVSTKTINLDKYWSAEENNTSVSLSGIPGSSVKITNGKLTLKLGTPANLTTNANTFINSMMSGVTVSDTTAKILVIQGFTSSTDDSNADSLYCRNLENSCGAFLVYVDKSLTAKGTDADEGGSIDLKLTAGWNIVFQDHDGAYSGNDLTGFNWYYRPASD